MHPTRLPFSTRDLERIPAAPSVGRTKTNPELAAEAAERANRALAVDQVETAVLELKKACELAPDEVDYGAMLGWALFCAADDKPSIAAETKKALERALHRSQQPHVVRFYLGRVARMLGNDREALGHFHAVLLLQPDHRDASAEVRVLEARLRRSN
jgi:cytochrome c-type biogenesis protein CcmH/NrfG